MKSARVPASFALLLAACASPPEHAAPADAAAPAAAVPPVAVGATADALQARVDELCAAWNKPDSPGCVVGVVRDGDLVFARGYGMANLEHSVPISASTVFDLGSTSKQFTAACIGLLAQQGKLSVDDDVRRWIPELRDYGAPITVRHLLHHTSGLRDYLDLFLLAGRKSEDWTTRAQALAMIARQKQLNFQPGERHLYSNSGYFLLAQIVERASGTSMAKFAEHQIFAPLGMRDTHVHEDHRLLVPARASGYSPRDEGGFGIDMSDFEQTGDGAVMTTVVDLAKWDRNFTTRQVGGEQLQRFLHEHGRLNDGSELPYCGGLVVDTFRGLERVSHGGAWAGYRAQLMRFPQHKLSVICMSNLATIDPSSICAEIANFVLAAHMSAEARPRERTQPRAPITPPPAPTAEVMLGYPGVYESKELEERAEIALRGGSLFLGEVGLADYELPVLAPDRFGTPGFTVEFARDAAGAITGFHCGTDRARNLFFAKLWRE
ncbi:MAG TPA: serine hydrolase domain-containing protein [Planctomycetota bacterium]|nr:serine hydrolase domain-containing protein [Planctomycetota bacterium]